MNQEVFAGRANGRRTRTGLSALLLLLAALFAPASEAQLTNLGKLTISTALLWDKNPEPDIAGYYVYAYPTNNPAAMYRVPTVTNFISAPALIGTNANGGYGVFLKAVNTAGIESGPSVTNAVTFAQTNIVAPSGMQFFLYTVATNLIPLQQIKP